jgi:hypothetical protein
MDIIIGNPLLTPSELGFNDDPKYTNERFLPRLLVNLGMFKSTSEVRRNRKDLWITLDKPDMIHIKIGKRILWILVGE